MLASKLKLSGDFDFREIARLTAGFVGADLSALTKEAALLAVNRIFQQHLNVPTERFLAHASATTTASDATTATAARDGSDSMQVEASAPAVAAEGENGATASQAGSTTATAVVVATPSLLSVSYVLLPALAAPS